MGGARKEAGNDAIRQDVRGGLTVGDTTGYETDDGKAAVEDTVCGV